MPLTTFFLSEREDLIIRFRFNQARPNLNSIGKSNSWGAAKNDNRSKWAATGRKDIQLIIRDSKGKPFGKEKNRRAGHTSVIIICWMGTFLLFLKHLSDLISSKVHLCILVFFSCCIISRGGYMSQYLCKDDVGRFLLRLCLTRGTATAVASSAGRCINVVGRATNQSTTKKTLLATRPNLWYFFIYWFISWLPVVSYRNKLPWQLVKMNQIQSRTPFLSLSHELEMRLLIQKSITNNNNNGVYIRFELIYLGSCFVNKMANGRLFFSLQSVNTAGLWTRSRSRSYRQTNEPVSRPVYSGFLFVFLSFFSYWNC